MVNKKKQDKMIKTSVTIPEQLLDKFRVYCKQNKRSVSAQVTLLIERELEQDKKNK